MENAHHNLRHSVQNKERRSGEQNLSSAPHECESEEKCQKLSLEMPKNAKRLEMPKPISQELCWHHQCTILNGQLPLLSSSGYSFQNGNMNSAKPSCFAHLSFKREIKGSLIEFRCTICFFTARNLKLKCWNIYWFGALTCPRLLVSNLVNEYPEELFPNGWIVKQ